MEVSRFYHENISSQEQKNGLYQQEDYYLLAYENTLFKITGAKACRLISESESQDFISLLAIDEENKVCFYSFYLSNTNESEKEEPVKTVICKKLGEEPADNFDYFVYFYKNLLKFLDRFSSLVINL